MSPTTRSCSATASCKRASKPACFSSSRIHSRCRRSFCCRRQRGWSPEFRMCGRPQQGRCRDGELRPWNRPSSAASTGPLEIIVDNESGMVAERTISEPVYGTDRPQLPCKARQNELMIESGDVVVLLDLPDIRDRPAFCPSHIQSRVGSVEIEIARDDRRKGSIAAIIDISTDMRNLLEHLPTRLIRRVIRGAVPVQMKGEYVHLCLGHANPRSERPLVCEAVDAGTSRPPE